MKEPSIMPSVRLANERKFLAESFFVQKPIVSIEEAREILGEKYDGISDTQIIELIKTLHLLAREYIRSRGSKS